MKHPDKEIETSSPIYQQVREHIQELIENGQLKIDARLPSERELGELFGSTRVTIREALVRLESEGLVYRLNRRGWFVAPPRLILDLKQKVNFVQMALNQGREPETDVIYKEKLKLPKSINKQFSQNVKKGFCLCRVRGLEGRHVMAEKIYVDLDRYPEFDKKDLSYSITELLSNDYGITISRETSTIEVQALDEEMATILATNNGAPCILITRKRYNHKGELADFNQEYWIHNSIQMEVEST